MTLTLQLKSSEWREHLARTAADVPGLVPVAKGNGYGFGLERLAREAVDLPVDCMAVGTLPEVAGVRDGGWGGDVVVLTPWCAADGVAGLDDPGLILTVARGEDLTALRAARPKSRVILELLTSMRRHGLGLAELNAAFADLGELRHEGWTIHLPIAHQNAFEEARILAAAAQEVAPSLLWLSHLPMADLKVLDALHNGQTRYRMGTGLWLGAPSTRRTMARVLDVHHVRRGDRIGYWQHPMPTAGSVAVISGGTAHGVALSAPTAGSSVKQRLASMVTGSMEAMGFALSPFTVDGRKRFFVEPPHMQSSLIFLPRKAHVRIGEMVPVELRLTTATVDRIEDDCSW